MQTKASEVIYFYDLDDTLLRSVTFSELLPKDELGNISFIGDFGGFMEKVKYFFHIVFSKEVFFKPQGDFVVVYDSSNKTPLGAEYIAHIQNLNPDYMSSYGLKRGIVKDMVRTLGLHEKYVVFKNIPQFHDNQKTIGVAVNDSIFESYKNAKNKMILTGRNIKLKSAIEDKLLELSLELPNYGVCCFSENNISIQEFKTRTILQSIKNNNWLEVHFFEDKKEWLDSAMHAVNVQYPKVKFFPNLVISSKSI